MKTIYLLPWEPNHYPDLGCTGYVRKAFGINYKEPTNCECRVWERDNQIGSNKWVHTYTYDNNYISSAKEAMETVDKALILADYILIKENEVERFESKLKLLL